MARADWRLANGARSTGSPYERLPQTPLDNVLIVGAGSGSDVAIALSKGAKHVDAVEIDPRILQIGKRAQPRPGLPGPAGDAARQRRPGVPGDAPTRSTT